MSMLPCARRHEADAVGAYHRPLVTGLLGGRAAWRRRGGGTQAWITGSNGVRIPDAVWLLPRPSGGNHATSAYRMVKDG